MTETTAGHDREAWRGLVHRDAESLGELFDRHHRAVYNFLFRRTASWSLAEDLTQAVFATLWRRAVADKLPDVLDHESALPWLLGIADRESRNASRGRGRLDRLHRRIELVDPPGQSDDPADEVASRLDDERRMRQLRAAVAKLPDHERITIELVTWAGLSITEAAAALGLPQGTVKSRLFRARTRLAHVLAPTQIEGLR